MRHRDGPRPYRWFARRPMKKSVGSQDEENPATHKARQSWPSGGDAQETVVHCSTWSDWAVLATDGTTERSTTSSAGPMVSSKPGVMTVRPYKGERVQVTHMRLHEWPGAGFWTQHQCRRSHCSTAPERTPVQLVCCASEPEEPQTDPI